MEDKKKQDKAQTSGIVKEGKIQYGESRIICSFCGEEIKDEIKNGVCPYCNTPINDDKSEK